MLQSPLPFEKLKALPSPGNPRALDTVFTSRTIQAKQSRGAPEQGQLRRYLAAMTQATKGHQAAKSQGRRSSLLLLRTR